LFLLLPLLIVTFCPSSGILRLQAVVFCHQEKNKGAAITFFVLAVFLVLPRSEVPPKKWTRG